MKPIKRLVCCVIVLVSSAPMCEATLIEAFPADLGGGRWQFAYSAQNDTLGEPILEFRVWFDRHEYDNLAVETPEPLSLFWDELVMQPDPVLDDDGIYDALALDAGILPGDTEGGFVVSFDWLGLGAPGSQSFDILNPTTFEIIESGQTEIVPEPATVILLGVALVGLAAQARDRAKARKTK